MAVIVASGDKKRLVLAVAVALVDQAGLVLIAERPAGKAMAGFWEFPGGKLEAGESPSLALCREVMEELGVVIDPRDLAPVSFIEHEYDQFILLMPLFLCRKWQGEVKGLEGQKLAWVAAGELADYSLLPADLPLVEPLVRAVNKTLS
ncbi:MAG: (deoxy)nucleoside triphosphate pyrophosphohydrolase [Candidatus Pacebacteria bacterium]|nr:(deoxy)nucleoside triphosphate pyrophosphohydrolase [Candidatus Paceibacterota bacterium]